MTNQLTSHPLLEQQLYKVRNPRIVGVALQEALEQIGTYVAAEMSRDFPTRKRSIKTPMGAYATHGLLKEKPIVIGVLRAGMPFADGIRDAFESDSFGYIAAARDEATLKASIPYAGVPHIAGRHVILADTMVATGGTIVDVLDILRLQRPEHITVAGVIATPDALARISLHDSAVAIYAAVVDPTLLPNGYISPGAGDVGDRAYGKKIELRLRI